MTRGSETEFRRRPSVGVASPGNGISKPVPVLRGQMRAPGARLRPVPLPARESPNPCASSAHVQRNSLGGACTLPSRSLVLARPGLTWMHRCEALCRTSSSFTVMGQDERGHGIGGRGRIFQVIVPSRCAALSLVLGCPRRSCPGKRARDRCVVCCHRILAASCASTSSPPGDPRISLSSSRAAACDERHARA